MRNTTKLYLPYAEWPRADKALWKKAFRPAVDPFDGGGPGAHLSERTIQQLEYTYGKFLYFISAEHHDLLKRPPARRPNPRIIGEFADFQPETCGAVTLSNCLGHLSIALRYLCPREPANKKSGQTKTRKTPSGDQRNAIQAGNSIDGRRSSMR